MARSWALAALLPARADAGEQGRDGSWLHTHALGALLVGLLGMPGLALGHVEAEAADAASVSEAPSNPDSAAKGEAAKEMPQRPRPAIEGARPQSMQLQEVVVTGSRLPPAAGQSAQDVRVYGHERIERSGQSTVSDFLATVPEVSLASPGNTTISATVRLRGAIFGSPLILINGRRTQPVTGGNGFFGFFDLNTIPLSLVERIEVLPSGSSAIYGGDALAGVVNIVLRSNFTGAEGGVGYRWADKIDENLIWAGGGWKPSDDFSFSIMASASHRGSLLGKDRDITSDPDLRRFGGPNLGTTTFGVPANVSSVSGNLPGLDSSFAAVPRGSSGVGLAPADFAATAGTQNTGSFTRDAAMVPELRSSGGSLGGNVRITPDLEAFAELLATQIHRDGPITPPSLQLADVPASNPFNPFGTTVQVSGVVHGAESLAALAYDEKFVRPLLGVRGTHGSWQWELTALDSRDNGSQVIAGQPNAAALNAALASSNPATALNPFVDGSMASASLLSSIYSNNIVTNFNAESKIVDAFARGPLLQVPAGPMNAIFGAEHESSRFENGFRVNRTARAIFAELRVPLLAGASERGQEREVLSVQGAARDDHYSDFGSKATWQAGFELRPVERLLLRGTHATAFKPPTLYQLGSPTTSFPSQVNDPGDNGQNVTVQAIQGGNAGLNATTGESSTLGFVWSPTQLRDLNVSMTRWWSRINQAIGAPVSPQFVIDNESSFPGRVIRDSAGNIVAVDETFINFGTMRETGIDVAIDWKFNTSFGTFTPALAGTCITEFNGSSAPGAPSVSRLSRANNDGVFAPRVKGIVSIGWTPTPAWNASLAGRYTGRYTDYTPPREIGNFWYLDASVEVAVERALHLGKGSLAGMKLSVSGTNLTNKLPAWSTFFRGYDVFNYDIVGRTVFVRAEFLL